MKRNPANWTVKREFLTTEDKFSVFHGVLTLGEHGEPALVLKDEEPILGVIMTTPHGRFGLRQEMDDQAYPDDRAPYFYDHPVKGKPHQVLNVGEFTNWETLIAQKHYECDGWCGGNGVNDDDDTAEYDTLASVYGDHFMYFISIFPNDRKSAAPIAVFASRLEYPDDGDTFEMVFKEGVQP